MTRTTEIVFGRIGSKMKYCVSYPYNSFGIIKITTETYLEKKRGVYESRLLCHRFSAEVLGNDVSPANESVTPMKRN